MQGHEEIMVGESSSAKNQMTEFPPDAADSGGSKADESGPLEERLVSKNWSVRSKAFEELANVFTDSTDNPHVYKSYSCSFKKYLGDSNPAALEKAIQVIQVFAEQAPSQQILDVQSSVVKILVEKGATHSKPALKTKAVECVLSILQASEDFESLSEPLIELINSKNLKVSIAACNIIHTILREFGISKLKIKPYLSSVEKLTTSSNGGVRGEAMTFYKEGLRWMGEALKPTIEKLRKAQQDELIKFEGELKELNERPVPTRFTKKDALKQKEADLDDICKAAEADEKVDAYDLADAGDVLSKFQDPWCDKILELKKWTEKKEELDVLIQAASIPKILNGNQGPLIGCLKKLINDSNVMVSQVAVKAAGQLAKGLRNEFNIGVKTLAPVLLLRFKEKRQSFLDELHSTLESFLGCIQLDEIIDEACSALTDKAPNIKKNNSIFLEKAIRVTYIDALQKIGKELCAKMAKLTEDGNSDVRDAGLTTIGVLKGRLGEPFLQKFLNDLNPQKRAKVDEASATVSPSKYDKSQKRVATPEPVEKPMKKKKKEKPAAPKNDVEMIEPSAQSMSTTSGFKSGGFDASAFDNSSANPMDDASMEKPIKKDMGDADMMMDSNNDQSMGFSDDFQPPKKKRKIPPKEEQIDMELDNGEPSKPPPDRFKNKEKPKPKAEAKKAPSTLNIQEDNLGEGLSREEAIQKCEDIFTSDVIGLLDSTKWQEKVEGYKSIGTWCTENEDQLSDLSISEAIVKLSKAKLKDWKESNMNIIKENLNLFGTLAKAAPKVNKRTFQCIAPFISEKIGDSKYKELCTDALLSYAELVGPGFVAKYVLKHASSSKSPNVLKENSNFLSSLVEEFTVVADFPLKESIEYAKISVGHSNPAVRTASICMLGTLYKFVGETIKNFLKDIKESTMKIIDEEFTKITPLKKNELKGKRDMRGEAAEDAANSGGGNALDSLFPRADISNQLNAKVLKDLTDNNWKIRKEGCEKIQGILEGANMRIQPTGLTEFVAILKRQLSDSNKSVLKAFIQLYAKFSEALGQDAKNFSKTLLKPLLSNLADKQNLVRQDAVATMDKYTEAVQGAEQILNYAGDFLKTENPEMRTEMLAWVLKNKDAIPRCDTKSLVTPLVMCLSDKSASIRSNAELVIMEIMPLTKQGPFNQCVQQLKPAFQNQIKPLIEKVMKRCNLGADPLNSSMGSNQGFQPKTIKAKGNDNDDEARDLAQSSATNKPRGSMVGSSGKALQPGGGSKRIGRPESGSNNARANSRPKTGTSSKALAAEVPTPVGINIPCSKEKRAEYDRRSKWLMDEPREDHKEKCKDLMIATFGPTWEKKLFSKDFKTHVECVSMFSGIMKGEEGEIITQIIDLLVKWTITRFWENINTSFAKAVFEFFDDLLEFLERCEYQLLDFEANVFLALLTEKSGYNQQTIKDKIKGLIKKIPNIYPPKQTFGLLMHGLIVKNLKSRAEVLDEITYLVKCHGPDIATDKEIKNIAQLVDHADNGIRSNAVNVTEQFYRHLKENIWGIIGKLPQKAEDILKTRFKKVGGIVPSESRATLDQKSPMNRSTLQFQKTRTGSNSKFNQSGTGIAAGEKTPVRNKNPNQFDPLNKTTVTPRSEKAQENNLVNKINKTNSSSKLGLQDRRQHTSRVETEDKRNTALFGQKNTEFNRSLKNEQNFGRNTHAPKATTPLKEHIDNQDSYHQQIYDQEMDLLDDKNQLSNDLLLVDDQDQDDITKIVRMLKFGDLSKRVDTLVILNDMVSTNVEDRKLDLMDRCNDLLEAITHVLMDIFDKPVQEIPLRFAKYFLGVVHKVSSCKYIVQEADDIKIFEFAEQLLTRLLIQGLETMGERKEGELILKSLNGAMLRLLELCKPTSIFCVLIDLLRKYKSYSKLPKLPGLIIKCLLKLTKILDSLIEVLNIQKILMSIHLYLLEHPLQDQSQKTQQDEMGTRIVKTMINELVKLKKEHIWEFYQEIDDHSQEDIYIKRWIQIILKSQGSDPSMPSFSVSREQTPVTEKPSRQSSSMDPQLKRIFEELNDINMFNIAIEKLIAYEEAHPHVDIDRYLQGCSATLQSYVHKERKILRDQKDMEKLDAGPQPQSEEKEDNQASILSHGKHINDSPSGLTGQGSQQKGNPKISEYQRKLATMKQMNKKFNEQGMNKSTSTEKINNFHAMNSSLKDKWEKVNKNSQLRKQGEDNLSNTIGGGGSGSGMKFGSGIGMGSNFNSSAGGEGNQELGQMNKAGGFNTSSNSELINRLNEMKQKLRAIKQQKDQS